MPCLPYALQLPFSPNHQNAYCTVPTCCAHTRERPGDAHAATSGAVATMKPAAADREIALLWTAALALSALVVTLVIGRLLETRHIYRLPVSGIGVLIGALCAGVVRWTAPWFKDSVGEDMLKDERFDYDFFMVALLPPIIFEAGFNLDAASTMRNIGPTVFFAFAGTSFSTVVVGAIVYGAGQMGICYPLGFLASITFGALVSATDPVSVLSVFKACGVQDDVSGSLHQPDRLR